jgi:hypothetical protein
MEGRQKIMGGRNKNLYHKETRENRQENLNGDQVTETRTGGVANHREISEGQQRREDAGVYIKAPHQALTVITENADPSLVTQGWVGDKPCLVTVDTGAYVTVARPDIAAGWPERQLYRFTL